MKECDNWGNRLVSTEVIIRSSVCLCVCVGKETCWVRLAEDKRSKNLFEEESRGSSTHMLKSPVMRNSWGVVAADDRKISNSSRKVLKGLAYLDVDGGWYILKTVRVEE